MTATLGAIGLYLAIQFGIGLWVRRRIRTEDDYLIAGRRMGYLLVTFSLFATWFGAETIIASSGAVATEGLSLTSAEPFGYGLCLILLGIFFAAPLWRKKLTTLADLFESRYSSGVARLAAFIMIPSSLLWAAAQIRAFGYVLGTASTFDPRMATIIAATIAVLYTAVGGMLVDAITDVIQGGVLVAGLVILLFATVGDIGGWSASIQAFRDAGAVHIGAAHPVPLLETMEAWAIPVFGSLVAAELVSRVIAARSESVARRSALAAGVLYISIGLIPVFLAIVMSQHAAHAGAGEQLLPELAQRVLPTAGYMIFAAGLISAILSTVDSTLLVASGLFSHNLAAPMLKITSERGRLNLARGAVIVFGIICCGLAITAEGVFELVELASSLGSSGVLVTVVFGLFTRIGGRYAAGASLIAGATTFVVANHLGASYPFLTSLAVSLLAYLSVAPFERAGQAGAIPAGVAEG